MSADSGSDLAGEGPAPGSGWLGLAALLTATFAGSYYSNALLVPLNSILEFFHAGIGSGALVLGGFTVTLAAVTPIASQIGERVGWTRALQAGLLVIGAGSVGAALSPDLAVLVAFRVAQGIVAALVVPAVMMIIAHSYPGRRRVLALGAWSSANSLARVAAVPMGGFLVGVGGWRAVFWSAVPLCGIAMALVAAVAPRVGAREHAPTVDWPGALRLTVGAAACLGGLAALPAGAAGLAAGGGLEVAGLLLLRSWWRGTDKAGRPLAPRAMMRSVTFARSSVAAFVQMMCVTVDVAGAALYLVRTGRASVTMAGLIVLVMPLAMVLASPLTGWVMPRLGGRRALWAGLIVLACGQAALTGVVALAPAATSAALAVSLAAGGAGAAAVQTAAAGGATRTGEPGDGNAVGMFNFIRFAGSAVGAAWLAVPLALGAPYRVVFAGCALATVAAYLFTRRGREVSPVGGPGGETARRGEEPASS